jgi:putative intracellular protease/amidase
VRIGIPIHYQIDLLDVAGPFEMFSWAGFDITIAAHQKEFVECRGGLAIQADTSFSDSPRFDTLWTPGGEPDALAARMEDSGFLDFLSRQSDGVSYVCSVCEGALLLAAAGLLDGYEATTHWAFIPPSRPEGRAAPGAFHADGAVSVGFGSRATDATFDRLEGGLDGTEEEDSRGSGGAVHAIYPWRDQSP